MSPWEKEFIASLKQDASAEREVYQKHGKPSERQLTEFLTEVERLDLPRPTSSADTLSAIQILFGWVHRRMAPLSVAAAFLIALGIAVPMLRNLEPDYWGLPLNPGGTKGQTIEGVNSAIESLVPETGRILPNFLKNTVQVRLADSSVLSGGLKPDPEALATEKEKRYYVAALRGKTKGGEAVEARLKLEFKPLGTGLGPANLTTSDIRWAKADVTLWNVKDTNKTIRFVREGVFSKGQ